MESTSSGSLKRKSKDVGWEFGVLVDPKNKEKIKCTLCENVYMCGIYRFKHHVAGIKGNIESCTKATNEQKLKCQIALDGGKQKKLNKLKHHEALRAEVDVGPKYEEMETIFGGVKSQRAFGPMDTLATHMLSSHKEKGIQSDLENVVRKEQLIRVKEYICRWIYECSIPFNAFEKDSFKLVMEAVGQFGPRCLGPTQHEIGESFLKKEVERVKKMLKGHEDEWKLNGCSVMTDAWSDRKRRSIMNLCVNCKLGIAFLSSKECSDDSHTSDYIYEYVESCILEVGPENVVQVVTNNASNNMGAAKLLKEKRPTIFWTSFAAHTINLMLEAIGGLPTYKATLDRAKQITVFIYAHHKSLALMRQYTNQKDIVRPGVTRFASSYLTLLSLVEKKEQLRHMFGSNEWEACNLSWSKKGKEVYALVIDPKTWDGIDGCLKVFGPLFKILRMVDADWKPSMGFLHGELKKAQDEIKNVLNKKKRKCDPIMNIIANKMKGRLDTPLHLAAYLLNPFYIYNNMEILLDSVVNDAFVQVVETLYPDDFDLQRVIVYSELPIYKNKQGTFNRLLAIKGCEVNDDKYIPANWWENFGGSTPNLRRIAMRILSLTTSSSGCERNWSTFEAIHTKKRNRLGPTKINNLVYVQFNINLMEKQKKRKERNHEVFIAKDASEAQEWMVDEALTYDVVSEAMGVDEYLAPRRSARITRELYDEDFESENEEDGVSEDEDEDGDDEDGDE